MSENPYESPHGRLIREAREDRGWSRDKLSRESGVSETRIFQIEQGWTTEKGVTKQVLGTPRTLRPIAKALGLDPAAVLRLAGHKTIAAPVEEAADLSNDDDDPVVDAILANTTLLPEAKSHFLNQYRLLLRVAAAGDPVSAYQARVEAEARKLDEESSNITDLSQGPSKRQTKRP